MAPPVVMLVVVAAAAAAAAPRSAATDGGPRELLLGARAATAAGDAPRAAALYVAGLASLGVGTWASPGGAAPAYTLGLDASLAASPHTPALLDEAADALGQVKQPGRAAALRAAAQGLRLARYRAGDGGAAGARDVLTGAAALARDLQNDLRFREALAVLDDVPPELAGGAPAPARAVLLKMRAGLHSCAGDDAAALATFETARRLPAAESAAGAGDDNRHGDSTGTADGGAPLTGADDAGERVPYGDAGERLQHLDLTRRALAAAVAAVQTPASGRAGMSGRSRDAHVSVSGAVEDLGASASWAGYQDVLSDADGADSAPVRTLRALYARRVAAALAAGPWESPHQLPRHYVPGLASRAWHSVPTHWPHLVPVVAALEAAAPALAGEWATLRDAGRPFPETECVHDAGRGGWRHYSVEGPWLVRDAGGCSVDAPVLCALLRDLHALRLPGPPGTPPLRVLRSGYSAVGGRSHLRPHHGHTNAQLKLHVGLIVPAVGGGAYDAAAAADPAVAPCARLRVGNETRPWVQGRVLAFDDSFEHAVDNTCDVERVVVQVVFAHPELGSGGSSALKRALAGAPH